MRRLRVMQLVLSLSPGGTERLVIEMCRRLEPWVDSTVCCLDEAGEWASELKKAGVPVLALGREPGFHPSLAVRIARLIRRHQIDVLHCHHYSPFVYGVLGRALQPRARLVFTEHGRLSNGPPSVKRRCVNPLLARLPGRVFAVSADLKRHMVAEGFRPDRVDVLYNGIEIGELPRPEDRLRARDVLGIPHDAYVIGTVGRLDPVKNLPALIDAHATVSRHAPGARLIIVGSGPTEPQLQARVAEQGIAGIVHFAGFRSDVRAVMAAFDVYVNCSTYEGVSLTILEAMATGLPVVATRVGGNPEVVVDGETGTLVPVDSPGLTDELISLAGNPAIRDAMGDAGRRRVVRDFAIDRMVDQYARVYGLQSAADPRPTTHDPRPNRQTYSANSNSAR